MNLWSVHSSEALEQSLFESLEATLALDGEQINVDRMSRLVRLQTESGGYYIKSYVSRGRGLRRWLGRSRLRAEWENLLRFRTMGVSTAEVVACGETRGRDGYTGALVMRELAGTRDLASLAREGREQLSDAVWRKAVIHRLSEAVRALHDNGFVHNDLKWRNILVDLTENPQVYVIDCPAGRVLWGPFLTRGKVKDLACLDKVAKSALSRTDRLRFYLAYRKSSRLSSAEKIEIAKVLRFFSGRE